MVRRHSDVRLGPLEVRLLAELNRRSHATVRELLAAGGMDAAYTTIMTTLDRLYKKGLVERSTDGRSRAYRYRLNHADGDVYRRMFGADLQRVLMSAADPSLPLSFLVETVTEHDAALLDELERAVERKRRALRDREKA